jgi:broad specificity phosphatase PhoE
MSIRLILVAHAETDATRRGVFSAGEGLNERGREAAGRLVGALPQASTILTSPAAAAREIAMALDQAASVEQALRDLDVGTWTGRQVMDIAMTDPEAASAWIEDPSFAGHGGESVEMLIRRVGDWLTSRRSIDGVVIGVTHAAVLRAAAVGVLGAPAAAFWRIEAAPLTALTLSGDGRRWTFRELRTA